MLKNLLLFIIFIIISITSFFLLKKEGYIEIEWLGYYIYSSTIFITLALIIFFIILHNIYKIFYKIYNKKHNYKITSILKNQNKEIKTIENFVDFMLVEDLINATNSLKNANKSFRNKSIFKLLKIYLNDQDNNLKNVNIDKIKKEYINILINRNKSTAFALLKKSQVCNAEKSYNEALFYLKKAFNIAPNSPKILKEIINSCVNIFAWPEVISYILKYEHLLQKKDLPYYHNFLVTAYTILAQQHIEKKEFKAAHKYLSLSLEIKETDIAIINYAIALFYLEKYRSCEKFILRNWLKVKYKGLIDIFDKSLCDSKLKARISHLKKLLNIDPNNINLIIYYTNLLIQNKDYDEAKNMLVKININQYNAEIYKLFIKLEEETDNNTQNITKYEELAEKCDTYNPSWQCTKCQQKYFSWKKVCFDCNNYGTIDLIKN